MILLRKILKLKSLELRSEGGVTLIEVVIATLITSLLSVVLYKTSSNASMALTRTSQQVISNFQIVHFASDLRYNVAGSSDVYTFGTTPAASTGNICSSWDGSTLQWTPLSSYSKIVRPLFSVRVKDLIYDRTNPNPPIYSDSTTVWYGYELRTNYFPGKAKPANFEIWRVTCDGVTPVRDANQDRNMLILGSSTNLSTYNPSGSTVLKCVTVTAGVESATNCPVDSSTLNFAYYILTIPLVINSADSKSSQYNRSVKEFINNPSLQILKRKLQVIQ